MLENLQALDLAGVTGNINYSYNNAVNIIPPLIMAFVGILMLIICIHWITSIWNGSRSSQYRKLMTDMYVVGMVKKFAAEDKIDLLAELAEYIKIIKRIDSRKKDLDIVVEQHLNEKIADKSEEKVK